MIKDIFINFSNHNSKNWGDKQIKAALCYGEIVDIPFPEVLPALNKEGVCLMAKQYVKMIEEYSPKVVMCQGEFTLCFAVVSGLQEKGIKCVAACSERKVVEKKLEDGNIEKTAYFEFVRFREY